MPKVLIADDEPGIRKFVSAILERSGYEVLLAEDGLDAYNVIRQLNGKLDLLITDIRMPKMTGTELSERLKIDYPNVRILCISAYTNDWLLNCPYFLTKPFTGAALLSLVKAAVPKRT